MRELVLYRTAAQHTRFVLRVPQSDSSTAQPPVLVIGTTGKNSGVFQEIGRFPLTHSDGIRFLADVVMAFGHDPYSYIDFDNFHLKPDLEPDNPDSYQSDRNGQLRDGFGGNSTAVNYITSHDIESPPKARLYNFLIGNGIRDVEKRAQLAFALLLTSVGIPMIFAASIRHGQEQSDPVNYGRKNDGGWRQALKEFVWRWQAASRCQTGTAGGEISQGREVPLEWVGREPLAAWEAKVCTRWTERP
ncbi:uncharacterized protein P884DRAFT_275309 [Thermothelomyces heterothallicus CBS 202.75]|uniref:uncharacterized protein n=1 Tax=Thermothelomyces heterothallicus CBS 202.75 TaxID=1149848 RepID=UPI00374391EA